jgi:hypothetical protein
MGGNGMMTITAPPPPPPPPPPSPSLQQSGGIHAQNNIMQPGVYASGNIASLQNDKDRKSAWLLSSSWRGSLTNITSAMSSSSNANNTASKKNLPTATFNAVFSMVMLNGSELHRHQISNFSLTDMSMPNNGIIVYNGTATITMKEGPVNDVPLSIKTLNDNVISIWVDPAKTMNHFGNTPVYGTITRDVFVRKEEYSITPLSLLNNLDLQFVLVLEYIK